MLTCVSRHCAQARAVENECYVVICGSVGNLPEVESLDVQYAQSSVFFAFRLRFPARCGDVRNHAKYRDVNVL